MSSRKPLPLKLSPQAYQDLVDILRYTGEAWGREQLHAYRDKIDNALLAISHNPRIGSQRQDLPKTHRAYLVGSDGRDWKIADCGLKNSEDEY